MYKYQKIIGGVDKIEKECVKIEEKIDMGKKERLEDLEELRIVYAYKLIQQSKGTIKIYYLIKYELKDLLDKDQIKMCINNIKENKDLSLLSIIEEYEERKKY